MQFINKYGVEVGPELADQYGVRWERCTPEPGAVYFELARLREKEGPMEIVISAVDENWVGLGNIAIIQGWKGPEAPNLPDDAAPLMSPGVRQQPAGLPNTGEGGFTNANGDVGWSWGGGEGFDPETMEAAHWYYIMPGLDGVYSDVSLNHGWLWDTNHAKLEPTFMRKVAGGDPEPPSENGGCIGWLINLLKKFQK